jgi:adenylate kinase
MKTKIMILTGIPCSGRTSILKEVVATSKDLMILNYGDVMLQIAEGQKIERDSLRKLPLAEQQAIGLLAAEKIEGKARGITIVDTPALIKTPVGYVPGFPQKILSILKPEAFIVVETKPQILYERRNEDTSRVRDLETIEDIEYHQSLIRAFVIACCAKMGAAFIPIQNNADRSLAVKQLIDAIHYFKI